MVSLNEIELLYNSIPTACIVLKADKPGYTIAAVNNAFLSATYSSRSNLVGRHFFAAFPANPDDDGSRTQNIINAFDHVLHHKTPHLIVQHRYDLLSSSNIDEYVRYWNIETYPLLDEDGRIEYIVQSSVDVTALVKAEKKLEANNSKMEHELQERKQVERALKLSNERNNYVNKATNDAIYDWDLEIDHIHWGEAFFRLFGYPREGRFPIDKWAEIVHPEDISELERSLNDTLEDQTKNNWVAAYRLKRINCDYAHVEENGYILRDEQGRATRMIGVIRDVSARRIAEAELKLLKDTYSDLFQLSPLPMWVFDLNSLMFLDVNEAAVAHYGYTKDEFLTMSIRDIRPEEDAELLASTIRNEIKPRLFHTTEVRHLKKSGEVIIVSTKGNSIRYGVNEARIVVAVDITEKIKSQKALIDSERRFKTLIQEGSDLISILDIEGNYNYVSTTAERILEMKPETLIGKNAFSLIHEDDREAAMSQFQLLNSNRRLELKPFRFLNGSKIHWVETIATDMRDDETISGIVCNSRVVTDRVENELKIKEHLDRYNAVSKATSDSIWDMDMLSGKLLWNHGIKNIFGYREVELNYRWWYDRVHPDDINRVTEIVDHNISHKISRWTSEYRFQCADGTYKYVLDRGILIFDDHTGQPLRMIGAMQDISERVAYTKAIEEHNVRLKEIAWTQAHLVRAPLARILGLIALLNDPENDECTKQTLLSYLNTSAMNLDEIVKVVINKSNEALKSS